MDLNRSTVTSKTERLSTRFQTSGESEHRTTRDEGAKTKRTIEHLQALVQTLTETLDQKDKVIELFKHQLRDGSAHSKYNTEKQYVQPLAIPLAQAQATIKTLTESSDELKNHVVQLKDQNQKLSNELEEVYRANSELQKISSDAFNAHADEVKRLQDEIVTLRTLRHSAPSTSYDDGNIYPTDARTQLKAASQALQEKWHEIYELQQKLATSEQNHVYTLEEKNNAIASLESKISQMKIEHSREYDLLKKQNEQLVRENQLKIEELEKIVELHDSNQEIIAQLQGERDALLEEALRWEENRQELAMEKVVLERSLKESRSLCESMITELKPANPKHLKSASQMESRPLFQSNALVDDSRIHQLAPNFESFCSQVEEVTELLMKLKQDLSSSSVSSKIPVGESRLTDFVVQSRITAVLIKLQTNRSLASHIQNLIELLQSLYTEVKQKSVSHQNTAAEKDDLAQKVQDLETRNMDMSKELEEVYAVGANLQKLLNVATETLKQKSGEASEAKEELQKCQEREEQLKKRLQEFQETSTNELQIVEQSYKEEWARQLEALNNQEIASRKQSVQYDAIKEKKYTEYSQVIGECQETMTRTKDNMAAARESLERCRLLMAQKSTLAQSS